MKSTPTVSKVSTADVYTRVTSRIIADLEKKTRPWLKPWNVGNTENRITRPLRHMGILAHRDRGFRANVTDFG